MDKKRLHKLNSFLLQLGIGFNSQHRQTGTIVCTEYGTLAILARHKAISTVHAASSSAPASLDGVNCTLQKLHGHIQ